jgi:hypothetical protein
MTDGRVRSIVPPIYDSYVRILHPAHDGSGNRVRWSGPAREAGIALRAELRWAELVGLAGERGSPVRVATPPEPGCLDAESMKAVIQLIDPMGRDAPCIAGIWDGWGWLKDLMRPGKALERAAFPYRTYLMFEGPLRGVAVLDAGLIGVRSPNLLWPVDRSWFLASEVDLDSSILCGSGELCEAALHSSEIEALPVGPDDVLAVTD